MFGRNFFKTVAVLAIVFAYLSICGCKKHEHPAEHPSEHPTAGAKKAAPSKDGLADAVEAYVEKEAAAYGGYFLALDEKTGQELKLTLDKVHRARLSKVGKDTYFACADFRTPEGKIYDLDVFMKGPDKDNLTFSKFSVHKEDGKERYTWYEEGSIWKKKPMVEAAEPPAEKPKEAKAAEEPKEHPSEHPEEKPKEHPSEHPT